MKPQEKSTLISEYGRTDKDTGSTPVQVAVLTHRIKELTSHVQTHNKDHHTRRGLIKLVGQRRRLLRYLSQSKPDEYRSLIARLGLNR